MTSALLAYVLNALWQVPLVAAGGWLAARLLRPFGPRAQHRVWVSALLLQTVLPACAAPTVRVWTFATWLHSLVFPGAALSTGSIRIAFEGSAAHGGAGWSATVLRCGLAAYGGATAWLLLRLLWRLYRLHVLRRNAQPAALTARFATIWAGCASHAGVCNVDIVESTAVRSPVTVGCRRLLLLLPPGMAGTLDEPELRSMLAHEAAHMRRNDFAKNLMYEFLVLPVAFHPALWWTRERVTESREMVCDAMASAQAGGNERFAADLLRLALLLAGGGRATVPHAIGMFDAHTLERRIAMLTEKTEEVRGARRTARVVACAALAFALCGSAMALRLQVDGTPSQEAHALHVKSDIMAGSVLTRVQPVYPDEAKQAKVQGAVVLKAVIGKQGEVRNLRVVSGPEPLRQASIDAVKRWQYKPYLLNGDPTEVTTDITVTYSLGK